MRFINLNILSDFIQALNSTRKHYTKNDHFPMHNLFSTVYLLQEQNLNHNKYIEQEIITRNLIQATEYERNMHAKFQDLILYRFL
jgi:hypothetical protein